MFENVRLSLWICRCVVQVKKGEKDRERKDVRFDFLVQSEVYGEYLGWGFLNPFLGVESKIDKSRKEKWKKNRGDEERKRERIRTPLSF